MDWNRTQSLDIFGSECNSVSSEVCIFATTYFKFRGKSIQKLSAAMESCVSPIVATLYMEHLDQKAVKTALEK